VRRGASELLKDVGRLLTRSHDLEETLANVVRLVARWMRAGGCSVYLAEDDGMLVLRATKGLRAQAVGNVRLRIGEGIVGACLEAGEPIAAADAALDPRFRPFPQSGESRFRSLLAVPLFVRSLPVGVLTVQTAKPREYTEAEIELLEAIAGQVATIALNARLLDLAFREGQISEPPLPRAPVAFPPGTAIAGIATSPGFAEGPIHLQPAPVEPARLRYEPSGSRRAEWRALEAALRESVRQISDLRSAVGQRFGEEFAEVFTTHIMILEDEGFRQKLRRQVFEHGNGVRALVETMREYEAIFGATPDPTIRERAADFEDVVRRVAGALVGIRTHNPPLRDGVIVVAGRIVPSELMLLETEKVAGLVTAHGGSAGHAAIFARSLEIPAVTGVPRLLERIRANDRVVIDGLEGHVIVNPGPALLRRYEERRRRFQRARARLDEVRELPCRDLDGVEVTLSANIGGLTDLEHVKRYGARGVGLFRTEILALASRGFPDEEEQVGIYRRVAETVAPEPVNVRIFDVGGDKALPGQELREENPQLGWRSIRVLLDLEEVFRAQLRAIVRANGSGNLRVLIPMVTSMEEIDATRRLLAESCAELGALSPPPVGVMIETPAAVAIADRIAAACDFLSIGTNDLVQYTLAVDRENERVAASYDPFHPAVLSQIGRVAEAAAAEEIGCAVCGELAGNPVAAPVLIGLGVRELSMTPFWLMAVRKMVRSLHISRAEGLARDALRCSRASEVRALIAAFLEEAGVLDDPDFGFPLRSLLAPRSAEASVDTPPGDR
jgi:phosphotransferase system enzyme I (PtsP)